MVRGIEQFKAFFSEFENNYVIIGGRHVRFTKKYTPKRHVRQRTLMLF
jgi:hypothetical protein